MTPLTTLGCRSFSKDYLFTSGKGEWQRTPHVFTEHEFALETIPRDVPNQRASLSVAELVFDNDVTGHPCGDDTCGPRAHSAREDQH